MSDSVCVECQSVGRDGCLACRPATTSTPRDADASCDACAEKNRKIAQLTLALVTARSYRQIVKERGSHHSAADRLGAQFDDDFLACIAGDVGSAIRDLEFDRVLGRMNNKDIAAVTSSLNDDQRESFVEALRVYLARTSHTEDDATNVTDRDTGVAEPLPPKPADECAYPTGCTRKRLPGLTMCRRHQPYPAR